MAYILGFITADGNVYKSTLSIEINIKDLEILEFIKNELSKDTPIKTTKGGKYCRIRFNSKHIIWSLKKYNVIPNKTNNFKLDFTIPNEYFSDYLRGFFDGDGWVCCRRNTIEFGLCSKSEQTLLKIKELCGNLGRVRQVNKNIHTLYVLDAESKSALNIRDIMYASNGFSLSRKREKFFSNFHKPYSRWWTEEQLQYLKDNFKPATKGLLNQLANDLGKSRSAVSKKIWELNLVNLHSKSTGSNQ